MIADIKNQKKLHTLLDKLDVHSQKLEFSLTFHQGWNIPFSMQSGSVPSVKQ